MWFIKKFWIKFKVIRIKKFKYYTIKRLVWSTLKLTWIIHLALIKC